MFIEKYKNVKYCKMQLISTFGGKNYKTSSLIFLLPAKNSFFGLPQRKQTHTCDVFHLLANITIHKAPFGAENDEVSAVRQWDNSIYVC